MSENLGTHVDNENPRHTSTLKKVVSVIEKENDIQVSQFLNEADETKQENRFLYHSKKLHEDNMCPLGIYAQQSRVDFAQKHLFRNGFNKQSLPENEEIDDQDEYSQEDDSCFTSEDESLDEASLTDLSHSHRDVSLDTNQLLQNGDESVEILHGSGSNNHSFPQNNDPAVVTQNIDMFMACCDWEAAIEEERELSQEADVNNHANMSLSENHAETQLHENNGTEGDRMKSNSITNHQIHKICKRKIKSDLKSRNTLESLNSKNESQVANKEPEIDIDSIMKKTPPNDMLRRAQKRILQQRGKKRSPTK